MSTADDLNLWVASNTGQSAWGASARNTTERVGLYHPNGWRTYTLKIYLITRRNLNSTIRGCVAIIPNGYLQD